MILKTNLHLHSGEDRHDVLEYSIYEAIDRAAALGFEVLAWTPHKNVLCERKHIDYAAEKGILLIPGIEAKIEGKEVLIINAGKEAESLKTFLDLKKYKEKKGDEVLIIAPHPFFPAGFALRDKLLPNLGIFEAAENSWFYTKNIDFNPRTAKIAAENKVPFIATSDTHLLKYLDQSYCLLRSEKNVLAVLAAVRAGEFENFSRPISFWQAVWFLYKIIYRPKVRIIKFWRKIERLKKNRNSNPPAGGLKSKFEMGP
jgi:predicted metal-dependent phosphoesterase TrpH